MAHSPDHARRLLRELEPDLPANASQVLERACYWDPGFVELFFEYTEDLIFRIPRDGLTVAKVAQRLAHVFSLESDPGGKKTYYSRLVRASGLLGTALRAVGQLEEAGQAYRRASRICEREQVSNIRRGELDLRWSILRAYERRFEEAFCYVDDAESLFKKLQEPDWLGCTEVTRGAVFVYADRYPEAVSTLCQALAKYKLSWRVEYSATANLALAVSESDDSRGLEAGLRYLQHARQLTGPRRSVQKSYLYWIEGLVFVRLGSTERAEHRFKKALQGFSKFEAPYEIALVGLDLACLYRFSKRWTDLEKLASDTYRRFQDLREDIESLAALQLWLEATKVRDLTLDLLDEIKAQLSQQRTIPPFASKQPT